jgi:UDP-N-acetylmuramoylalanine--D-glutamate ligase
MKWVIVLSKARAFFESIAGKRVVICGIGNNNVPVVHLFLKHGAHVVACDKRTEEALGEVAEQLRRAILAD